MNFVMLQMFTKQIKNNLKNNDIQSNNKLLNFKNSITNYFPISLNLNLKVLYIGIIFIIQLEIFTNNPFINSIAYNIY